MADTPTYTEKELLLRIAEGDEKAFHELVNNYAHVLYTFIFRIVGNRQMAEELIQDTFVKIWLTREHLPIVQNFKAYLFVISKNFAIKAAQRALKERKSFNQWKGQSDNDTESQDNELKIILIEEAINNLPPQQYRVWVMSRKQGMKYAEIAEELGLSRESVKKYLQFANASIMKYVKSRLNLMIILAVYLQG